MRALALVAALTAATLIPGTPLGVDIPVVAGLVLLTVATRGRLSFDSVVFGGLALALACVPAFLDAGWVVALDLAAAWALAAAAVAGPRLVALIAPLRALDEAPALVPPAPMGSAPVVRGALLGGLVVLPFAALFWSADAAFAQLGRSAPLPSFSSLPARALLFALVLFGALGFALAARRTFADPAPPGARLGVSEWAIPLALLDALFLVFVVVQVTVLFGGNDHVLETAGLTYAEYARQGFWQLLVAVVLTVVVVGAARCLAIVRSRREQVLLHALLGALCALTLVVVASALDRLRLYEDAYGLTRPRLAAETFAWGLGGLLALLLLSGAVRQIRKRFARLVVLGSTVGLLAFSISNPDGRIAERNVERSRTSGKLDISYAQGLSADAVPALAESPEPARGVVLEPYRARLSGGDPWYAANLSRSRARELLAAPEAPAG
jgi:hypothetical protein